MQCPVCKQEMDDRDVSLVPIGNSKAHKTCYDKVHAEAAKVGAVIHCIWRGAYCTELKLVFEDKF